MNYRLALFCLLPALLFANPARGSKVTTLPMKYEGGTLWLEQGKTLVTISEDKMVFTQGRYKLAIPLQKISEISCNTEVHRRFAAPVLGAVPRLHLDLAETHYVGLTWTGNGYGGEPGARIEGVFKVGASDYDGFLKTLGRLTGRKAVDTHRVPAVVRYGI